MIFTAVELRESAEPAGTDHTGDIVSFTAVGSGAGSFSNPPVPGSATLYLSATLPMWSGRHLMVSIL